MNAQPPAPCPSTIAIDGPVASGKSTVGQKLAQRLGYLYFDTGVMYRAVTWAAIDQGVSIEDEPGVTRLAESVEIVVAPPSATDGRQYDVLVDGVDVTWDIRRPDVEKAVSPVSAYVGVRKALTAQQRTIGLKGRVVMVGRDIGTVVLPDADLKIYLDASAEERARRRHQELLARGKECDYDDILAATLRRDQIDSTRAAAPLRPADDAIILPTDDLGAEGVVQVILRLIAAEG
jgi:CMP/dCMP kinase